MSYRDDEWSALGLDDDDSASPRLGSALPRVLFGRLDSDLDSHLVRWGGADTITPTMTSGYEYDNDASILSLSGTEDFSFDQVGVRYEFVRLLDHEIGDDGGGAGEDDNDDDLTSPSWPDDEDLTLASRSVFISVKDTIDPKRLSRAPSLSSKRTGTVDGDGKAPRPDATNDATKQDPSTPEPRRKKEIYWEPPRKSGANHRSRTTWIRRLVGRRSRRQKEKLRLPAYIIINDYIYSLSK
jgi:hypothetical protein